MEFIETEQSSKEENESYVEDEQNNADGNDSDVSNTDSENNRTNRRFFIHVEDTDTSMDDSGLEITEHIENQNSTALDPTAESSPYKEKNLSSNSLSVRFHECGVKTLTSLAAAIVMRNEHSRKFELCLAKGACSENDSILVKSHNLEESVQAVPWYPPNLSVTSGDFSEIQREDASTPLADSNNQSEIVRENEDSEQIQLDQNYESVGGESVFFIDASNSELSEVNLDEALLPSSTNSLVDYSNVRENQQIDDPAIIVQMSSQLDGNVPVIQYPYLQQVVISSPHEQVPMATNGQYVYDIMQPHFFQQPPYEVPAIVPVPIEQEIFECSEVPAVPNSSDFQYPAIYISDSGLITVLLKHDISVEMTVDQTIRLVCHQRKIVVATNNRGNSAYIYHSAAKIMQRGTSIDAEVYLGRRAQMTTDAIIFGNNFSTYKFNYNGIDPATFAFPDISRDSSVNFLFETTEYGPAVASRCADITMNAHYEFLPQNGVVVRINGVKIIQAGRGDVSVVCGPKYMKMSPISTVIRLHTHFVEMAVEMNWNVKIRRGCHTLNASHLGFVVSNGKIEAGFDENNCVRAFHLPRRIPIRMGPRRPRRPGIPSNRRATALGGQPMESC